MGTPTSTDSYPPEVYSRHINEALKRGDKTYGDPHTLLVTWNPDFDQFVANVAYELRRYITYRSDGGRYARGLVKDSEEIRMIFNQFKSVSLGSMLRLQATLWRRKSTMASGRWALIIHFGPPDVVNMDREPVVASPDVSRQAEKTRVEELLHLAIPVADNIARQSPYQGERIHKMLDIAIRLGYPRCLSLWYYDSSHTKAYLDPTTSDVLRRKMTAETGGNFPFDGWYMQTGQRWQTHQWREFPFREILKTCRGLDPDSCRPWINNIFLIADDNIFASMRDANIRNEVNCGVSSAYCGRLWERFFEHLVSIQRSPDHLLSAYAQAKRTSSWFSWLTGAQ